jgi:hypothetical protein
MNRKNHSAKLTAIIHVLNQENLCHHQARPYWLAKHIVQTINAK